MTTLDPERIPQHIAIIMDGNGRWAKARGLDRSLGHQEGAATVRDITEEASNLGVKFLTLYTFSTENWSRPEREVATLMALIIDSLEEELFMAFACGSSAIARHSPTSFAGRSNAVSETPLPTPA